MSCRCFLSSFEVSFLLYVLLFSLDFFRSAARGYLIFFIIRCLLIWCLVLVYASVVPASILRWNKLLITFSRLFCFHFFCVNDYGGQLIHFAFLLLFNLMFNCISTMSVTINKFVSSVSSINFCYAKYDKNKQNHLQYWHFLVYSPKVIRFLLRLALFSPEIGLMWNKTNVDSSEGEIDWYRSRHVDSIFASSTITSPAEIINKAKID